MTWSLILSENPVKFKKAINQFKEKERAKEFLSCLGNGKSVYEIENENDEIDKEIEKMQKVKK